MTYNVCVTERADELLDNILHYLIYKLKNEQAAKHLLDEIEHIYGRLEENPLQFPICRDIYLGKKAIVRLLQGRWITSLYFVLKRML